MLALAGQMFLKICSILTHSFIFLDIFAVIQVKLWFYKLPAAELAAVRKIQNFMKNCKFYRVTRRVVLESLISRLHLLFKKNFAGYLKTHKVTRI